MTDVREATDALLADKPKIEDDLRELLAIDEDGAWTFDDTSLDSGAFGEIVSQGIVEEVDGGYRIADREAVRAALGGDVVTAGDDDVDDTDIPVSERLRSVSTDAIAALLGALLFVVIIRIAFMQGAVFRNGDIVLAGNDPYAYWRQLQSLLANDLGILELGSLRDRIAEGDVLFVVTLWWVASITGSSAATVLTWYPVAVAAIGSGVLYLVTRSLTSDRRIALASVVMLAITPVHAYRTALGFGDHDGFDLLWLTVVVLALVILARRCRAQTERQNMWRPVVVLGIGIGAQTLAWRGSALLLAPIALYTALTVLDGVRADRSPLRANTGLIVGLGLGSVLALFPHFVFGWAEVFRVSVPILLLLGAIGVVAIAEVVYRFERSTTALALAEGIVAVVAVALLLTVPPLSRALSDFIAYMETTGQRNIAETMSLISGDLGSIVGPVFVFGLLLFLAIPYLCWVTVRTYRQSEPAWLVVAVYAWYFLVMSLVQLRFSVTLAPFVAIFAGLGFVHLASWVDLTRPIEISEHVPTETLTSLEFPDKQQIRLLVLLFLLVGSLSFVQIPVKMQQIAVDDASYEAASWMKEHSNNHGLAYPNNSVFAPWDKVRMYNYLVGLSKNPPEFYQLKYGRFMQSTNGTSWYSRIQAGYIVVYQSGSDLSKDTMRSKLTSVLESEKSTLKTEHYRLVFNSDGVAIYRPVSGASLVGHGPANTTITIRSSPVIGSSTYDYETTTRINSTGGFEAVVPYAGQYRIGNHTVDVSEAAVSKGETIRIDNRIGETQR